MASRHRDNLMLVAFFQQKLQQLRPVTPECSIYRLPKRLRSINNKAYTPQVISIGPFHRGLHDYWAMEQHKLWCLDSYLRRLNMRIEVAIERARNWESDARSYYAEEVNMTSDDFVKMMLMDGCFILMLMILVHDGSSQTQNRIDPSLYKALSIDLYRDLIMFENQLPFFVLQSLFEPLSPSLDNQSLEEVTNGFFCKGLIKSSALPPNASTQRVKHLVHFLSFNFIPFPEEVVRMKDSHNVFQFQEMSKLSEARRNDHKLELPPSATELYEAGVIFKKATAENIRIMGISFTNGVLEIPAFEIHDAFETYLRNVMALEHFCTENQSKAIYYVAFLDGLISTEKDVHLLVKAEIITNHIGGSDKEVEKLFNDLCKDITIAGDFHFSDLNKSLRSHCMARRNKWKASLRRDYFNTPWALFSFFGASLLIFLTFLQTVFSGLQASK